MTNQVVSVPLPHTSGDPDFTAWVARLGLRTRMVMLVGVAALPALAVLAYTQFSVLNGPNAAVELTGSLLVLGGTLMSLGFGMIVGEHFIRRPADALLAAAAQWSAGNFDTRIAVDVAAGCEFTRIAETFNGMAEVIGRKRIELSTLNADLEQRVETRTHELSQAHAQLLAEMAERERAEETLRQNQKLQAVGQLAGGIAHDFNNLLTTVVGALDLLRGRLAPAQESLIKLVDSALSAADRGSRLTAQLLTFSRRQRLSPVPTDMNDTIHALMDLLRSAISKSITVQTELSPDLWKAMVDPSQVEATILNLAINARDAMPQGGILRITTQNIVQEPGGTLPPGDYVVIQVTDNGVGMDEKVLSLAFEPFFTTKEPGRGSGLGLSQVHGLAAQSGGEVRIKSVPGLGTTVMLLLPRASANRHAANDPLDTISRGRLRARVLVVDDDHGVREMTEAMLADRNYIVVGTASAEEALALLATGATFDLMLTDFVMPGMNGLNLIKVAGELYPAMRTMLMTGHADLDATEPLGLDRMVKKPFNISQIDERVSRVLGRPRLTVIEGGVGSG